MLFWCLRLASAQSAPDFEITLETVRRGYDGKTFWVHPRAGLIPGHKPAIVMTMMRAAVTGSDVFSPIADLRSDDLGRTWSEPREHKDNLGRRSEPGGVECGVCDFTPQWHAASGKLLNIGQTVRYLNDKVIAERPREVAWTVHDAKKQAWAAWETLKLPDEPRFYNCGAGSAQRVDLADGTILLPTYFRKKGDKDYSSAVMRCKFDGRSLSFLQIGDSLSIAGGRGLYEPSLTRHRGKFYLTLRNDAAGYVATSADGLQFEKPRPWLWDDGGELGNYNTQQHWVAHSDGLFLVYTRKGANNDHVFRHRAPLFIAQVDLEKLRVIRATERVLVPKRGARLGNFGVLHVSPTETWVTVAEWMQTWPPKVAIPVDNPRGADNSIYVARLRWRRPNAEFAEGPARR
jgi:hypothetical protein